ncbi:hypothetical protein JZ751_002373 [Albula glossodonta]|uniref:Uncharacterized protein n=1 Tax=Albula glossodonta TaxID=121402 RepID=A0A8T2P560_9TELE|nr:hypothetical protein JZ751_002373 [Albula glossodonta]
MRAFAVKQIRCHWRQQRAVCRVRRHNQFIEARRLLVTGDLCAAGLSASFGVMLLMVVTRFHSNEVSAIFESVSSTSGMKIRTGHRGLEGQKQAFKLNRISTSCGATAGKRTSRMVNFNSEITNFRFAPAVPTVTSSLDRNPHSLETEEERTLC